VRQQCGALERDIREKLTQIEGPTGLINGQEEAKTAMDSDIANVGRFDRSLLVWGKVEGFMRNIIGEYGGDGELLKHLARAKPTLARNQEVVTACVSVHEDALRYAAATLLVDTGFLQRLIKGGGARGCMILKTLRKVLDDETNDDASRQLTAVVINKDLLRCALRAFLSLD